MFAATSHPDGDFAEARLFKYYRAPNRWQTRGQGSRGPSRKIPLMNFPRLILAAFAALLLFIVIAAQTPRRPATSRPATKPAATPTPAAAPSPSVAIIDGTAISASDIEGDVSNAIMHDPDPYLRDYYVDPAKAINEAR